MSLQPFASVKDKIERTRSVIGERREYDLVTGTTLTEEGQVAVAGGTGHTHATTSITGAIFGDAWPLGFFIEGKIQASTFTNYETGTVPAAPGPYTVTLAYSNLVTNPYSGFADAYVYDNTGTTELQVAGAAVAGVSVTLAVATGIMTFAAGDAGHSFFVRYRWNLTVLEAQDILRQSPIGKGSESTFSKCVVARGHCIIYTSTFDCDAPWALDQQTNAALAGNPVTGAGGVLTTFDNNALGTCFGRVVEMPGASMPYLGVEYPTTAV